MRYCNDSFRAFFSGGLDTPLRIQHLRGIITRFLCLIDNQRTKNSTQTETGLLLMKTTLNPLKIGEISNMVKKIYNT